MRANRGYIHLLAAISVISASTEAAASYSAPTPAIFQVGGSGNSQSPLAVHVYALDPVPQTCYWDHKTTVKSFTSPPSSGWWNVEADSTLLFTPPLTAAQLTLASAINACLVARDQAYNASMASKYLGGGDPTKSRFSWNFGDPGTAFNTVQGFSASHIYYNTTSSPVQRTITLTVTNDGGISSSITQTVTIQPDSRPVVNINTQSDLNTLLSSGTITGKKIVLKSGASFQLNTLSAATGKPALDQGFGLGTDAWVTSSGSVPATVITNFTAAGGQYPAVFGPSGSSSHIVAENVNVQIAYGSVRPYIGYDPATTTNVVYKAITFTADDPSSGNPVSIGPTNAFMPSGKGLLIQGCGVAPVSATPGATWASTGTIGEWAYITGSNIALYGNAVYDAPPNAFDKPQNPGIRTCATTSNFIALVQNDVGGYFGNDNEVSIRGGHNIYVGENMIRGGTFDLQGDCSNKLNPGSSTVNVVVEGNHEENNDFQINPAVTNVDVRNNFFHANPLTDTSESAVAPYEGREIIYLTPTNPGAISDAHISYVNNSFIYEIDAPNATLLTLHGSNGVIDHFVNNLIYVPSAQSADLVLDAGTNPLSIFKEVDGNVFLLDTKGSASTTAVAHAGSASFTLAEWNQAFKSADVLLDQSASGFPAAGGGEELSAYRPAEGVAYATNSVNLSPAPSGAVSDLGVSTDMADPMGSLAPQGRPQYGQGGWTPGAMNAVGSASPTSQIGTDIYLHPSTNSSLCMDVNGISENPGTKIQVYTCNKGKNQVFNFYLSSGQLRAYDGAMCIGVSGASSSPGSVVLLESCDNGSDEQWAFNASTGQIVNGSGNCLDIDGSATSGTALEINKCSNASSQIWNQASAP